VSSNEDDFVATPVFAHFIQVAGEWLGTYIAVVGAGVSLVAAVFLGEEASALSSLTGTGILSFGVAGIIIAPVYGFLIIVVARFIAEQCRALATIANNTKKKREAEA
jgi:hypothetical protein